MANLGVVIVLLQKQNAPKKLISLRPPRATAILKDKSVTVHIIAPNFPAYLKVSQNK